MFPIQFAGNKNVTDKSEKKSLFTREFSSGMEIGFVKMSLFSPKIESPY